MSSTLVLGIHIGDTTCSVAVHRQGIIDVVANEQGSRVTPAVVAFTDVETLLGEPARAQLVRNAANTVTNGMRLLGRKFDEEAFQEELATWKFRVTKGKDGSTPQIDVSVKGAQKSFTPSRLLSLLLERLRADAVASTGEEVKEATVALPEYFDAAQRAALKEAAQTGGIRVKTMLSAPLCVALLHGSGDAAAAAAPAAGGVERARQYLVVDLGGTSCEACVVEHAPRHPAVADSLATSAAAAAAGGGEEADGKSSADEYSVRASMHSRGLGGTYVDIKLRAHVVKEIKRRQVGGCCLAACSMLLVGCLLYAACSMLLYVAAWLLALCCCLAACFILPVGCLLYLASAFLPPLTIPHARAHPSSWQRADISDNARAMSRLLGACESAKISLTGASQASINVEADGADYSANVSRAALEEITSPVAAHAASLAAKALAAASLPADRVDALLLAGGGCRMPRVQAALAALCPDAPLCFASASEETVCRGAALSGAMLRPLPRSHPRKEGTTGEVTNALETRKRLPIALGVATGGGGIVTLVEKRAALPLTRSLRFAPPGEGDAPAAPLLITLLELPPATSDAAAVDVSDGATTAAPPPPSVEHARAVARLAVTAAIPPGACALVVSVSVDAAAAVVLSCEAEVASASAEEEASRVELGRVVVAGAAA